VQRMVAEASDEQQDETAEEDAATTVQTKRTAGAPDGVRTQEADRVAGQVMTMPEAATQRPNRTGLPDGLKSGIESLSGMSLDSVHVHHNSSQPAQLNALAYTQGSDIHVAPGQEQHLPHEAWHVVQQAQGRVRPTVQMEDGVPVNDDAGLEHEADVMAEKAVGVGQPAVSALRSPAMVEQGRAPAPMRPRAAGGVAQRLQVEGTEWSKVQSIAASASGAGGVLFMSDGSNKKLVVKPGVPGDEEMAAAHAHVAVSDQGRFGKWKVKALGSRMAVSHDVAGIRVARQRVEAAQGPLDARAAGLVDAVAADTTLIQQAASEGSSSMTDQMTEQSPNMHIQSGGARIGSNKDKVKPASPLKPLMDNNTDFARSLGRIAAADLLLGNFDRIVEAANLENLLLNRGKKVIHPIDNTGGAAVARLLTGGGGPVANPGWTQHRLAAMFIARDYAGIADDVWTIGHQGAAQLTFANDLLEGFLGPMGPGRQYNVAPSERAAVSTKLQNHIQDIRDAFAEGLQAGRAELVAKGPIPAGPVSQAAREQYAARLAII
jgi:hypothetical protein